jgi:transposase
VQERRRIWHVEALGLDVKRLAFIDETGVRTNLVRRYGRSRRGQRLVDTTPHGHWQTTTFVAALRHDGLTAPMVVDGAMNGPTFLAYVQQVLVPTLHTGDVVVMDNLSAHKGPAVQAALIAAGAIPLYLPPYSPDLNPIELAFAKLKWLVRSAAERTLEGLWSLLGRVLDQFPPDECLRYLRHCGYTATPRRKAL